KTVGYKRVSYHGRARSKMSRKTLKRESCLRTFVQSKTPFLCFILLSVLLSSSQSLQRSASDLLHAGFHADRPHTAGSSYLRFLPSGIVRILSILRRQNHPPDLLLRIQRIPEDLSVSFASLFSSVSASHGTSGGN